MLLIVLYILSILTIFVPYEPLKLAGILISICFLPGLCLFFLGKKEKLELEDLILAFPCSIGISSILILGLLYFGVSIGNIINIIIIITGIAVLFNAITSIKKKSFNTIKLSTNDIVFCFLAFLITLLLGIPVLLGSDRILISNHGFFHSSIITQILNGIYPPENPDLGGTNISYHWAFHTLIAGLSSKTNFHPLKIMSILNLLSLFWIFCIAYSVAKLLEFSERYRYLTVLLVIGLMRSDAVILFAAKLFSGDLLSLLDVQDWALVPRQVMSIWAESEKLAWYDIRMKFTKFYNANAMPLGLCLTFAYFLILLLLSKRTFADRDKKVYLISIGFIIIASVLAYLPLAIIPLLHLPIWAGFIFLTTQGVFKEKFKEASELLLPYLIAILLVLPYLLYIRDAGQSGGVQIIGFAPTLKYVAVFWLPFPVIIAGIWIALKRLAFSKTLYFLLTGTFLILGLSIFLKWGERNSYKFAYILPFFFSIFFVFALSVWLPKIHNRLLKGLITTSIVLLLLSHPISVETSYILSPRFRDTTYSFSDKHIIFAKDSVKNEAYKWIRDNTPPESLVMLTYIETDAGICPTANEASEPSALTERSIFVIDYKDYTMNFPEYTKRLSIWEKFFEDPQNLQARNYFTSLKRPVYLLVEDDFNELPENLKKEFPLMFHNDRQKVYLIHDKL